MPSISLVRSTGRKRDGFTKTHTKGRGQDGIDFELGDLDRELTFDASLPHCVSVSQTRDNVVADTEGESQPVLAAFLQREPGALQIWNHGEWKDNVRPFRRDD